MDAKRRDFLKLASLSFASLAAGSTAAGCASSHAEGHGAADKSGRRWAMLADISTPCPEGCKACSEACHIAHNVPQCDEPRHEVKWIWHEHYEHVFHDQVRDVPVPKALLELPVPVLCNHCDNAPCVRVCPAQATYVSDGGLVAMDMHRCIGCRYCMAACPYGARSFNWSDPQKALEEQGRKIVDSFPTRSKGVVEKCNFCAERIVADSSATPACVEACQKACAKKGREPVLVFGDLNESSPLLSKLRAGGAHLKRRRAELGTKPHVFYLV